MGDSPVSCGRCRRSNPFAAVYCEHCGSDLVPQAAAAPPEPVSLAFSFLCRQRFWSLQGTGDRERFCGTCAKPVFNLDPLSPEERQELLARGVCVSATVLPPALDRCPPRVPMRLGGAPLYPRDVVTPPVVPWSGAPTAGTSADPFAAFLAGPPATDERPIIGKLVNERGCYLLREGKNTFGSRAGDSDHLLDDRRVSGRHFTIQHRAGRTWLFDENSVNGTFLNGEDILTEKPTLATGDRVRVGDSEFVVELASPSEG